MDERIKGRKNFPTDEIDPKNFISDVKVKEMVKDIENVEFNQEDFLRLYNCVQCGECETDLERIRLKQKFVEDGNFFEGLNEIIENYEKFRSPYPTNKMRIKRLEGIPSKSDTLFFMGCLSTIRIPRYTEHALQYLLQQKIDFTILDKEICCGWHLLVCGLKREFDSCIRENKEVLQKFKTVICLCPACFYLFSTYIKPEMSEDFEIKYITDYLVPSNEKKSGSVSVQHLCHLKFRNREDVEYHVNDVLRKSGYEVIDIPHWCCGGGIGFLGRTDVIDKIARKRMLDHKGEFCTSYCVSCWWILRRYTKLCRIKPKPKDIFELLL
jgi:Fe-S oxidoreductase